MRLLSVDSGAERCGWAVMEPGPSLLVSGVFRCHRDRETEAFQPYRLRLEEEAGRYFDGVIQTFDANKIINEIIPAVGSGNFTAATQSYLASCVVSVLHDCAFKRGVEVMQIAANTMQKQIGIKGRTGKVSKAGVRNGVLKHLPDLKQYVKETETWPWDRWDAIAIGLSSLGYVTR